VAWDTERTRRLLLDAASAEFASHGLAGARIGEISRRAGVSGERIYSYFGGKGALFDAVLAGRLDAALDAVAMSGYGAEAIGEFAGRYFDAVAADPDLARLVAWEGLERGEVVAVGERSKRAAHVVEAIMSALPHASRIEAEGLFITVVTLCHAWQVLPNLSRVVSGREADSVLRRRTLVVQSTAIAEALATNPHRPAVI
jgi:AcrR family transcriptional regulator